MSNQIENICGISEIVPDFESIGNNPNFVFTPDPYFQSLPLYDNLGNTINVNSWLECANYVNGGWVNEALTYISYEKELFIILLTITFIYSFKQKFEYIKTWFYKL